MSEEKRFVVKEYDVIVQYLDAFDTLDEAKAFAGDWSKSTIITELLHDGQVERVVEEDEL